MTSEVRFTNLMGNMLYNKHYFVELNGQRADSGRIKKVAYKAVCIVVVYPFPCFWGESDHPAFSPPASLSLHLSSISITSAGSVHKSRGDNVGAVVCVDVTEGA